MALEVCKWRLEGCDWSGSHSALLEHEDECPYQIVRCPNAGCESTMHKRELEAHRARCELAAVPAELPFTRKIMIPSREHPEMNFIGMLLGPRGVVLKMIENDSGTKVAIRGKPATRDVNDSDELHVLIRGPSEEAVEKAAGMVLSIITPPS
ncbi:hypothetical protein PAPYR_5550 [Paratrimastix pyriformis]|uniref:Branchpoint-bridging protein n=1 Tax=Paratrimastix pyriformis TaxID=342808 RepID=A0ABQ8UM66_9EUKA|nr:hypothetical protein PAPYR_5550 [Paratrimastix pyriformis]